MRTVAKSEEDYLRMRKLYNNSEFGAHMLLTLLDCFGCGIMIVRSTSGPTTHAPYFRVGLVIKACPTIFAQDNSNGNIYMVRGIQRSSMAARVLTMT